MITYEEYKQRYGDKNEKTGKVRAGIVKEVFDILNTEENFRAIFDNHVGLILVNDIFRYINNFLITKSGHNKGGEHLDAYKKLAYKFKDVIKKRTNEYSYELNDRFFEYSPEVEERTFFRENIKNKKLVNQIVVPLGYFEEFYRAINTNLGQELIKVLSEEKVNALAKIYKQKNSRENGMSPYFTILIDIEADWNNRIRIYEKNCRNLKFLNRSVKNARSGT